MPCSLIPKMVKRINENSDVVIASRYEPGGRMVGVPFHRLILSWGARYVMRLLVPIPGVRDYSTAYRAYKASLLKQAFRSHDAPIQGKGFSGIVGLLIRLHFFGAHMSEVPLILRYDFKKGESKMKIRDSLLGYMSLIVGFWTGKYRTQ